MKVLVFFFVLFIFAGGAVDDTLLSQETDEYRFLMLFSSVLNHVKSNYYKEVPVEALYKGAITGVLQELDPHTQYLSPYALRKFQDISIGSSFGVGIEFEIIDEKPTVISVIKGSPADKKNIKTGDILIQVDEKKIPTKPSTADLLLLLYGQEASTVKLTFQRNDEQFSHKIKREQLDENSILVSTMLDPQTAYIKCSNFSLRTTDEVLDALESLKKSGAKQLIIDLRDNPGGVLQTSIEIADLFLPAGQKIASTTGRKNDIIAQHLSKDEHHFSLPLAILINEGTASASEVLAGCLQDHQRATIVGTTSFGKGLIQSTFLLENGGALLMTIGEYRTPHGRQIQRNFAGISFEDYFTNRSKSDSTAQKLGGIHPDVTVTRNDLLDSLDYSSTYSSYITQEAVQLITVKSIEQNYKDYASFAASFQHDAIEVKDEFSKNKEMRRFIQIKIKSEIAGILWGDAAELDTNKSIDEQLQIALGIFDKQNE